MSSMIVTDESDIFNQLNNLTNNVVQNRWTIGGEMLMIIQERLNIVSSLVQVAINSHCPIHSLPPEILSLVFSLLRSPLPPVGFHGSSSARQTYDLIPVTHVCRRWRVLALGTPSLWSTLCETPTGHSVTNTFHARAQQAPLVIYLDRSRPSSALTALLGGAHGGSRLVELHLQDLHELTPVELREGLLAFPAPHLERAIVYRRVRWNAASSVAGTGVPIKPVIELFDGVAPRLRNLVLHDVPFLPFNEFARLTHLRLSFEAAPICWTLVDLLQLLSRAPSLEDVELVGLPTQLHLPHTSTMSCISLPTLKRLKIGDCRGQDSHTALMKMILSQLALPSSCAVRLYGVDARRLSPLSDLPIPFVERPTKLAINVTFTTLALTISSPHSRGSHCLELNTAGTTKYLLQQSVGDFLTGLGGAMLEVVVASQRVWPSWCDPNFLFSILPNVTKLTLCDTHLVDQCLDALRPTITQLEGSGGPPVLCPKLVTFHLPFELSDLLAGKLLSVRAERAGKCLGAQIQCTVASCQI